MKYLSVVIPTYNEGGRLPKTLSAVERYLVRHNLDGEIIVSDGGSKDQTVNFVKKYHSTVPLKFVRQRRRQGKGKGVKEGVLAASGQWVLFMDADGSTPIGEVEHFFKYKFKYEVIIGSRYAGEEAIRKQSRFRRAVSRFGNWIIVKLTGLNFKDTQCGFKLFSRKAAQDIFSRLKTRGWGFDVEVLLLAERLGYKVKEVPVAWRDAEGSHLRAGQDSVKTLIEVIKTVRRLKHR